MRVRTTTCSFVIVSWNAEQYLLEAIASIYSEWGADDAEVIVVDNDSSDGSAASVKECFPNVTVIVNESNEGFARGTNAGIAAASGDLLFLVNVDALLLPGSLDRMVEFMESHPDVGLMGPRVLNTDRSLQRSARRRPTLARAVARALALDNLLPGLTFHAHAGTADVDVLSGAFWVVRRDSLEEVGGLDEGFFMYAEDLDWSFRFAASGWRVVYFSDADVVHHGARSSAQAPVRFYVEMRRADLRYWRKHHGSPAMVVYALVLIVHHSIRVGAALGQSLVPGMRAGGRGKLERSRA
ncbi:MAG: glycosyltransferase family 2 protein, partial [Acidimicrobiia bacterium]|nr:glycosyltransferase family 2 protein [Acidimicrobiia bacterium]